MTTTLTRLGAWLHTPSTTEEVDRLITKLAAQGINTVCAYAKTWSGTANYPSAVIDTTPGYEDGRAFRRLIDACHAHGITVEAWVCTFTETAKSRIFCDHPDCIAQSRDGSASDESGVVWPCPARPETQEYELAICREILEQYPDLDRLHLDYIRYPWSGGSVCACAYCQRVFKERYGYDLLTEVIAGADERPGFTDFVDWRCSVIRGFVAQARSLANEHGKGLTAAVFPYYPSIIYDLGQDWVAWCHEGLVDAVYPMNYNSHPYLVRQYASVHTALLTGNATLLCEAIWARDGMAPETVQALASAARQPGVDGLMVFHADTLAAMPGDVLSLFANVGG